MGGIFNPESGLMKGLSYMGDLMILNFLYMLCCIPVITIGPAAAALYTIALKMAKEEDAGIVKPFFKAFKENFRKALVIWIIFLLLGAVIWFGSGVVKADPQKFPFIISAVYTAVAIAAWLTVSWVFALQARYENTIKNTIKNAFILGAANPLKSLVIMLLTALIPGLFLFATYIFLRLSVIWFLLGFSGTAVINSVLMHKAFDRINTEESL